MIIIIIADPPHAGSRRTSTPIGGTETTSGSESVCDKSMRTSEEYAQTDVGDRDAEFNKILLKPGQSHSFCSRN